MRPASRSFDIFCRVLDNYGDAGVALRLARQLAAEHRASVRLWIDDLHVLARIAPGVDPRRAMQAVGGIEVTNTTMSGAPHVLPDVVIEAFGCGLPEAWLDAMQQQRTPCLWINLEYLSAEPWIDTMHGLPSPQPHRPLTRWFYFPGFTRASGGLIREATIDAQRNAWLRDDDARHRWWSAFGVPPPPPGTLTVSLFCYPNIATAALFASWADDDAPVLCIVPEGVAPDALAQHFGAGTWRAGDVRQTGALTVVVAPFVDQPAFDRRLWSCALNIVRGEDSFVRAQWARRPLLWNIYAQDADAHLAKLDAFHLRYEQGADPEAAEAWRRLSTAFNRQDAKATAQAWRPLRAALPALAVHAQRWGDALAGQPDLARRLLEFVQKRL